MKLLRPGQWRMDVVTLVFVVLVAAEGGTFVAGELQEEECGEEFLENCKLGCNGNPKLGGEREDEVQCVYDSENKEPPPQPSCICNDKIGSMNEDKKLTCRGPTSKGEFDETCRQCIDTEDITYKLSLCSFTDSDGDEVSICVCAPSAPAADEQSQRSKFPSILAQILKALRQVRSKFSGRQGQ